MNLFIFFGCLGGAFYVIDTVCVIAWKILQIRKKYQTYKAAYEEKEDSGIKAPMGFKTKKEQEEIAAKMSQMKQA